MLCIRRASGADDINERAGGAAIPLRGTYLEWRNNSNMVLKKLISGFSALAVAVSAFAAMTVTAGAASTTKTSTRSVQCRLDNKSQITVSDATTTQLTIWNTGYRGEGNSTTGSLVERKYPNSNDYTQYSTIALY